MKIAVFDHVGNYGGGSKYIERLLPEIKKLRPDFDITFYGKYSAIEREKLYDRFKLDKINVNVLKSLTFHREKKTNLINTVYKSIVQAQQRLLYECDYLPYLFTGRVDKEIENICRKLRYDICFFPWPFLLKNVNTNCIKIGVFHDFNFKYFFGSTTFHKEFLIILENEFPKWLKTTVPIVSSNFMARELIKFYPQCRYPINVIHLNSLVLNDRFCYNSKKELILKFKINRPYLLYPTNLYSHKNLSSLFTAISILKSKNINLTIVLTGYQTDTITGEAYINGSVNKNSKHINVLGLGYVTNDEMNSLFDNAEAVISTSLYEAGNGPGLDAWVRGIPVLMSNIPAFLEHLEILGVKATTFVPNNPFDIADKIEYLLNNNDKAKQDAVISKQNINNYTWEKIAQKYVDVFEKSKQLEYLV